MAEHARVVGGLVSPPNALRGRRMGIGGRLILAFGVVAGFTLAATAVTWVLFGNVRENLGIIANESMPVTASSFRLSEQSARLTSAIPNLVAARHNEDVEKVMQDVEAALQALFAEARLLDYMGHPGVTAQELVQAGKMFRASTEKVRDAVLAAISSIRRMDTAVSGLLSEYQRFTRSIAPVLGSVREEIIASTRRTVAESATRMGDLVDDSFEGLRSVLEVQASVYLISSLMYAAAVEDDPDKLWEGRSAVVSPLTLIANAVPQLPDTKLAVQYQRAAERITRHASDEDSVFEMRIAALDSAQSAAGSARELERVLKEMEAEEASFARISEQMVAMADQQILARAAEAAGEGHGIVARARGGIERLESALLLRSRVDQLVNVLVEAAHFSDVGSIDLNSEQFAVILEDVYGNLDSMPAHPEVQELRTSIDTMRDIGVGENSIFALRQSEISDREYARQLQTESQAIADSLTLIALNLVDGAESSAYEAAERTRESLERGENTLLNIVMVSLIVVFLITWLYVLRVLVRRITGLSSTTLAIANGELDAPINVKGNDELSDMGEALEVFRDNAVKRQQAEQALRIAKDNAEKALEELEATQANLVQAEKMASLGQLTAGIAHEIKNPLNFVNNFSDVSVELLEELKEVLGESIKQLDDDDREDAEDLVETLTANLGRIKEHGARADRIVKGMLSHARQGPGQSSLSDLNALLEESVNLAYHGARAENSDFNVTLEKDLDPEVREVEIFPQEMARVIVNLIGNAFYAVQSRKSTGEDGFNPVVSVTSLNLGDKVSITVRDNGTGIPEDAKEKIFDPFFTTKPTGEGTGLGLSLSFDIVVKQHRGEFDVDSRTGEYTEFTVTLPRRMSSAAGAGE